MPPAVDIDKMWVALQQGDLLNGRIKQVQARSQQKAHCQADPKVNYETDEAVPRLERVFQRLQSSDIAQKLAALKILQV